MGRNTSVSLGNYFESFVDNKVSEGRFKNASEVIRAGLRLLEGEENKVIILKNAISGNVFVFKRNIKTGLLRKVGEELKIKSVSCVQIRKY